MYLFLLILAWILTACSDEAHKSTIKAPPIVLPQGAVERTKIIIKEKPTEIKEIIVSKPLPIPSYNFTFIDLNEQSSIIEVKDNIYSFPNIQQPVILLNFFSTWCPPCRGQIPHLSNLQAKYTDKVFIIGILMYDTLSKEALKRFLSSQKTNYFIASKQRENQRFSDFIAPKLQLKPDFNLPLMVMFINGKYYTHYEGSVPEEMIESDIKQALKKIEG